MKIFKCLGCDTNGSCVLMLDEETFSAPPEKCVFEHEEEYSNWKEMTESKKKKSKGRKSGQT